MPTIQPIEPMGSLPVSSNWYLVSVRTNKRDLFLRYLEVAITQNQLQELILAVEAPQESVYEDIVLLNLSDFKGEHVTFAGRAIIRILVQHCQGSHESRKSLCYQSLCRSDRCPTV